MGSRLTGAVERAERVGISISKIAEAAGVAALACIVGVTLLDVIGGQVFGWPVPGNTEIIGLLQTVAISAGLGFSFIDGKQIYVGFLRDTLKGRKGAVLETICCVLSLGFWAVACWMIFEYGLKLVHRGTGTFLLGIPHYPFVFWIGIVCAIPMCVLIVISMLKSWSKERRGGDVV